jgi:two-component system sensor histidine kinase KdpD
VDPVLFEQVFVNVLENANKYTPQEQLIEVHATHDGQTVIIEVGDHGLGFAPGTETQVFEKFFRGSHLGVPGAGLGLPICKGIVEAHGGHIRVKNRAGGGAIVRIVLPSGGTPPTLMFGDNA